MFICVLLLRFFSAIALLYSIFTICQDEKVNLRLSSLSSSVDDGLENPCGVLLHHSQIIRSSTGVMDYSTALLLQMSIALKNMENWIGNFTEIKFRMSFDEKEVEDEGMHYTWLLIGSVHPLPSINKITNVQDDSVSAQQQILLFENLDGFLIVAQEILKRFAVAWNHLTIENDCDDFHAYFNATKITNMVILCELDALCIATTERAKSTMALADYVTDYKLSKDNFVFPQILRNLRYNSDRSTRNFRIIKDYVRALQVFIRPMLVASSPSLSYPFADVL